MGLGNNSRNVIWVNISKGQLVTKKDNQKDFHTDITGLLTEIKIEDDEYQAKKFKKVILTLVDAGDIFKLQFRLDGGYGVSFCNQLPNANLKQPMMLVPSFVEKNDKGKQQSTLFIYQNGYLKWYFTRDNPRDLPQLKKTEYKGEVLWDNSDQINYFIAMLTEINKKLSPPPQAQEHVQLTTVPVVEGAISDDLNQPMDDLPF